MLMEGFKIISTNNTLNVSKIILFFSFLHSVPHNIVGHSIQCFTPYFHINKFFSIKFLKIQYKYNLAIKSQALQKYMQ